MNVEIGTVPVSLKLTDAELVCDLVELAASVPRLLSFLLGAKGVLEPDVVTAPDTYLVVPSNKVVTTDLDEVDNVFIGVPIGTYVDEKIVYAGDVLLTEAIVSVVPDVKLLCNLGEVLAPVPGVLPFTTDEEWILCGDVDVEIDTTLAVFSDEDMALESD